MAWCCIGFQIICSRRVTSLFFREASDLTFGKGARRVGSNKAPRLSIPPAQFVHGSKASPAAESWTSDRSARPCCAQASGTGGICACWTTGSGQMRYARMCPTLTEAQQLIGAGGSDEEVSAPPPLIVSRRRAMCQNQRRSGDNCLRGGRPLKCS